jgi:hypothetical protein
MKNVWIRIRDKAYQIRKTAPINDNYEDGYGTVCDVVLGADLTFAVVDRDGEGVPHGNGSKEHFHADKKVLKASGH